MQARIYILDEDDVYRNLAFEESVLGQSADYDWTLVLWRNRRAVVIGKHQNPWLECSFDHLASDGVALARRLSGGGAVYHDSGNLNFSFVTRPEVFDFGLQNRVILDAISQLGISVESRGRRGLFIDNEKCSGNAFLFRKSCAMHHGTVLISTDLQKLECYLRSPIENLIHTKAVRSIRSPVVNLCEVRATADFRDLVAATIDVFKYHICSDVVVEKHFSSNNSHLDDLSERYQSWEWNFGLTPRFTIAHELPAEFGELRMIVEVVDGCVSGIYFSDESLNVQIRGCVNRLPDDCTYNYHDIASRLSDFTAENLPDIGWPRTFIDLCG